MFDAVRNNKRIVQIFLALITLPFAFFGVESFRDGGAGAVASARQRRPQPGDDQAAGGFGFTIGWAAGKTVVVEANADLATTNWVRVGTNTLTDGASTFEDAGWTNHPGRFYRLREL